MTEIKKILVIIPTYNEAENIVKIIPAALKEHPAIEVLVVDDGSPDGTGECVRGLMTGESRVHLIERSGKLGLGSAYVTGFRWALAHEYDLIFEMDADFSHPPDALPRFIEAAGGCDLVIGSRYLHGLRVVNWPLSRLILSYCANLYTRFVTRLPVRDTTSGFKCFRRHVLESLDLDNVNSDGYAFQIEMIYKAWRLGYSLMEIPIIFVDRQYGTSKMSSTIIGEAAWLVWKLRLLNLLGRL